jgi:hypothetical protein
VIVIAIDPGHKESAFVSFNGTSIVNKDILDNEEMLVRLDQAKESARHYDGDVVLVTEQMQMFATAHGVGVEVFDSVFWAGMFTQAWKPRRWDRILRSKVRGHLGAIRGGDAAVRQALIERFGPYKEQAIGLKKTPGPLFGVKSHEWSALAIAVVWYDVNGHKPQEVRPGVFVPEF